MLGTLTHNQTNLLTKNNSKNKEFTNEIKDILSDLGKCFKLTHLKSLK